MTRFREQDQHDLVTILLRYWREISDIEQEFGLLVGKGDRRPRIDYFHDAIRAYTNPHKTKAMQARLLIELLAYDLRCLRYLASMPLASITHDQNNLSPSGQLVVTSPSLVSVKKKADRAAKLRLSELYEQYGVLFSALMKQTAEQDYHERTDAMNQDVQEISQIIDAIKKNAPIQQVQTLIAHLEDEGVKRELMSLLPKLKGKDAKAKSGLISRLEANIQKKDRMVKTIDKAHHSYATSQLLIYESARDMLKKMAGQGMNLVGQFVESALRGTGQGRGR